MFIHSKEVHCDTEDNSDNDGDACLMSAPELVLLKERL